MWPFSRSRDTLRPLAADEVRELRLAIANLGDLLVSTTSEVSKLRGSLAETRGLLDSQRGAVHNLAARLEQLEAAAE